VCAKRVLSRSDETELLLGSIEPSEVEGLVLNRDVLE
jgi:hypothetical protein